MTVVRNGEKNMTDQVWTNPGHGTASTDDSWAGLPCTEVELDPETPTMAAPGSMEKVMMLHARYVAGVPLWDEQDSNDHSQAVSSLVRPSAGAVDDVVEEKGEPLAI